MVDNMNKLIDNQNVGELDPVALSKLLEKYSNESAIKRFSKKFNDTKSLE